MSSTDIHINYIRQNASPDIIAVQFDGNRIVTPCYSTAHSTCHTSTISTSLGILYSMLATTSISRVHS